LSGNGGARDDRTLAREAVRNGDERAFRELYDRHTPRLLRFAFRLMGPAGAAAAEDVVQETWLRAVQRLHDFEWRSSLGTWLHSIALNVCRESWRRADTERVPAADPPVQPAPVIEARLDLDRALARLATGRRTVVVLHDLYGYKHREIARALGIAVGTSKSQLAHARRELEMLLTSGERHEG
jgi:RNA polymerase sigma factor (sigma-70 family)